MPVITFIDTAGAYPGVEGEEERSKRSNCKKFSGNV